MSSLRSALYEGKVEHRRVGPHPHAFRNRVFLTYLDLDEAEEICDRRWFWSRKRPNLVWFRRADYLGPREVPLREAVLDRVEGEFGRRPAGAVRMLTHLRTLGYAFNPVTFYYCFDAEENLDAVVAEITNTPWKERHAYVLDARSSEADASGWHAWRFAKDFHVSPFFDMDQDYRWRFQEPGESLGVHMTNFEEGEPVFTAGLALERRPLTAFRLASALVRHPFLTFFVPLAIYWQAARLRAKRTPFFTHPDKRPTAPTA